MSMLLSCGEARHFPVIRVGGDVVVRSGMTLGPRVLDDYELLYFPEGSKTVYRVGGRQYVLQEPCFIISRPGEMHKYEYDAGRPVRHLFIHFHYRNLGMPEDAPLLVLTAGGPPRIRLEEPLLVEMMKQILYIAYAFPDKLQSRGSALLHALLEEINGYMFDTPQSDANHLPSLIDEAAGIPPQIVKALRYIDQHLDEPLLVEELARNAGWTHEHFSRLFAQYVGRTPRDMIVRRRIEKACELLLYEEWNIKEIAFAVGFTDENYFCRVFKNIKGMTATSYRKKYYNPRYKKLYHVKQGDSLYPLNKIFQNRTGVRLE